VADWTLITLTAEERQRFSYWAQQEAATIRGLINQMERSSMPDIVLRKKRSEALALIVVADMLEGWEEQTL
jgi:hypothetical protein